MTAEETVEPYKGDGFEYGLRYVDVKAGGVTVTAVREDIARALVERYPQWYTLVRRPDAWEEEREPSLSELQDRIRRALATLDYDSMSEPGYILVERAIRILQGLDR